MVKRFFLLLRILDVSGKEHKFIQKCQNINCVFLALAKPSTWTFLSYRSLESWHQGRLNLGWICPEHFYHVFHLIHLPCLCFTLMILIIVFRLFSDSDLQLFASGFLSALAIVSLLTFFFFLWHNLELMCLNSSPFTPVGNYAPQEKGLIEEFQKRMHCRKP